VHIPNFFIAKILLTDRIRDQNYPQPLFVGPLQMDCGFDPVEWSRLSPGDRARHCKLMADAARSLAVQAAPQLKEYYLTIANSWMRRATEISNSASSGAAANPA
jgi:hypothetical protein